MPSVRNPSATLGLPEFPLTTFFAETSYDIYSGPCGTILLMPPTGTSRMASSTNCSHLCLEELNAQMFILLPQYPLSRRAKIIDNLLSTRSCTSSCITNPIMPRSFLVLQMSRLPRLRYWSPARILPSNSGKRLIQESKTRLCMSWLLAIFFRCYTVFSSIQ